MEGTSLRRDWRVLAAVLVMVAIILFPIYWMVVTAHLPTRIVLSRTPPLLPPLSEMTFDAFGRALLRRPFLTWLANTMLVAIAATLLSLVIATLAGYSLSRYRSKAQELSGLALLVSKMLPGSLIVIPFFIMASRAGMIDSRLSLILANTSVGVPFATWMMKGFFDAIPRELDAAAAIDGCSRMQALWHVVLPVARPGLTAAAIYLFIVAWADFVFARTLINSPELWTLTTGLASFVGEHGVDWPGLMAAGSLSLIPVFILFVLLEPYLVSGMAAGAVK
ncbi:carbohydrate ABC transporter permease [Terrarubrum flagellatum]|uniref:carbohydrate ABC transporter permease n=1 Tax=Terrirubrum flagellatum TaxID=2895980 RepID=UPI00314531CB